LFEKKLEELAGIAKIPAGVLGFVYGDGKVGDMLAHADIDMLCFTGSTKTGKYLYTVAAEKFIPVVMEMGGSAPGIIFADVNLSEVIDTVYANRFVGGGQMCDGLKRLIVHKSRFDEVVSILTEKIKAKKIGLAIDPATEVGPLVAERQVKALEIQVADARAKGATIVIGGNRPAGLNGAFYEPTLVTGVTKDMKVWTEETFGPILPIVSFTTEAEAIELANDTAYGLGAYIFTQDKSLMERVASKIQSGMVGQNNLSYIKPYDPFGGYKQSGIGREHGKYGFEDVTQVKVVAREK
jgi:acyl-CoA reductase-like NAD-dependent aldehyde dehydrogenase